MELRPYQRQAVRVVREAIWNGERAVVASPTGSGKTLIAEGIVEATGRRTLFIAHRREILRQTGATFRAHGHSVGVILAGEKEDRAAIIQVAAVQTLVRRRLPEVDLVIIDEAHHCRAETYTRIVKSYPDVALVGLTATPFRLDGKGLGQMFDRIIVAATVVDLVRSGHLIEPTVYAAPGPSMARARIVRGDYGEGDQYDAMVTLTGNIVATWQKRAAGRRTVVFAVNVKHSKEIVAAFQDVGIAAAHLDGTMSTAERDDVLERLQRHEITIVSSCMVLTEGWDLPVLEVAIVARPTASLNLHLQMLGRCMRAAEGKAGAVILDHAGNYHRHGPVTQDLQYSLDDKVVKVDEEKGRKKQRICPKCDLVVAPGTEECPGCGYLWPKKIINEVEGELVAVAGVRHAPFEEQLTTWLALEEQRRLLGFKEAWTGYRFKDKFGAWPVVVKGTLVDPTKATETDRLEVYQGLVEVAIGRGYDIGWASHAFRGKFGAWPPRAWKRAAMGAA